MLAANPTNKSWYQFQSCRLDATVELIGRVNEAVIFVGDIQVTALINTGAQVSTITQDFCEEHIYKIHSVKQMLQLEGPGGLTILYLGYIEATVRIPPIKGMILRNLSAQEVRIPPKSVISNVQTAEIVPNMKAPKHTSEVLPPMEQTITGQPAYLINTSKGSLSGQPHMSLQFEPHNPTLEHDVLEKMDLLGCTKWDLKDQQEARKF